MKKAKPRQTQATTSEFHEGTTLVPEELLPLLNLPVFLEDNQGRPVPNYPHEDFFSRLRTIWLISQAFLGDHGSSKTKREETLTAKDWKLRGAGLALKLHDIYHKADNEPAVVKDALAALFHVGALQVGVKILEEGGPSDARTWFNFGATCAFYLGAATARLDSLVRHESDARLGNAVHKAESKGGEKTAELRWGKGKPDRERRNSWWRSCNDSLRKAEPSLSRAKRCKIIAEQSTKLGFTGSSKENVSRVLYEKQSE